MPSNAPAAPNELALFECYFGTPSSGWGTPGFESPSNILRDPIMLDFTVESEAARVSEFGLSRRHIEKIATDDPAAERELRRELLGDTVALDIPEPQIDEQTLAVLKKSGARHLTYINTIARTGYFLTVCPVSGRPLRSEGSFVTDTHHTAYRFTGDVLFYLFVGRFHGRRSALCIPSKGLLIGLDVPERGPDIIGWVANLMRVLISHSLAQPDKFKARIESRVDELTLVMGGNPNFGHHVWQELSGVAELLATRGRGRITGILVGPHTWFDIEQLFPEFAGIPITRCANANEMMIKGFGQPGTILRPVAIQVTEDIRVRCRRAASIALGAAEMARIAEMASRRRLIWINLRAHNKRWLSQVEGYAAVLNSLEREFGNIGVVYDGWKDAVQIRDEIDQRLLPNIVRIDTLGAPIETSVAWAEAVTTYISVVGSGLVINSWLVHKPGIAHSNQLHLRQRSFWNIVSPGMIPTTFVAAADVKDDGSGYGNYDFDWRILLPTLRDTITAAAPRGQLHPP